jgi:hypothetical protein
MMPKRQLYCSNTIEMFMVSCPPRSSTVTRLGNKRNQRPNQSANHRVPLTCCRSCCRYARSPPPPSAAAARPFCAAAAEAAAAARALSRCCSWRWAAWEAALRRPHSCLVGQQGQGHQQWQEQGGRQQQQQRQQQQKELFGGTAGAGEAGGGGWLLIATTLAGAEAYVMLSEAQQREQA